MDLTLQDLLCFSVWDNTKFEFILFLNQPYLCNICCCIQQFDSRNHFSDGCSSKAPLVKQYPAKLRLITLQCSFSCIQAAVWGIATERNISAWKLGWDVNLFSVVYCGVMVA